MATPFIYFHVTFEACECVETDHCIQREVTFSYSLFRSEQLRNTLYYIHVVKLSEDL